MSNHLHVYIMNINDIVKSIVKSMVKAYVQLNNLYNPSTN